jgi:hypothetical protein
MLVLTVDNVAINLNHLPDNSDEDIRYSVLDNNIPSNPDFYFLPLIFLESFNSPAMVLQIGDYEVTVPVDWSIAIGDTLYGCDVEILPLTSLNDRGFEAFCYNPINSFRVEFKPIKIVNFYNDVKWYFPRLKPNHLLSVPLSTGPEPLCAYFIKEYSRQSELIDLSKLV